MKKKKTNIETDIYNHICMLLVIGSIRAADPIIKGTPTAAADKLLSRSQ